jgi:hypothetical protein
VPGGAGPQGGEGRRPGPGHLPQQAHRLHLFLGGFGVDWFYLSFLNPVHIVVGIIKLLLIGSAGLCCCKISWDIFGIKDQCAKMLRPCRCAFAIALFVD